MSPGPCSHMSVLFLFFRMLLQLPPQNIFSQLCTYSKCFNPFRRPRKSRFYLEVPGIRGFFPRESFPTGGRGEGERAFSLGGFPEGGGQESEGGEGEEGPRGPQAGREDGRVRGDAEAHEGVLEELVPPGEQVPQAGRAGCGAPPRPAPRPRGRLRRRRARRPGMEALGSPNGVGSPPPPAGLLGEPGGRLRAGRGGWGGFGRSPRRRLHPLSPPPLSAPVPGRAVAREPPPPPPAPSPWNPPPAASTLARAVARP